METELQIADRWRYLRHLLIEQLARFEDGTLAIHSAGDNVSQTAITRLQKEIQDFDGLIQMSEKRSAGPPEHV